MARNGAGGKDYSLPIPAAPSANRTPAVPRRYQLKQPVGGTICPPICCGCWPQLQPVKLGVAGSEHRIELAVTRVQLAPVPLAEHDNVVWPAIEQLIEQLDDEIGPVFATGASGVLVCENAGTPAIRNIASVMAEKAILMAGSLSPRRPAIGRQIITSDGGYEIKTQRLDGRGD